MNPLLGSSTLNTATLAINRDNASVNVANQIENKSAQGEGDEELREVFGQFVGQTFFGQMMKAMRTSVGKPAYFHGGRGEEVFQGQLDQVMVEKMSEASHEDFAEPMYELFQMNRR